MCVNALSVPARDMLLAKSMNQFHFVPCADGTLQLLLEGGAHYDQLEEHNDYECFVTKRQKKSLEKSFGNMHACHHHTHTAHNVSHNIHAIIPQSGESTEYEGSYGDDMG